MGLEAVRARHAADESSRFHADYGTSQHADRGWLLAEVDRLTAERDRLAAEYATAVDLLGKAKAYGNEKLVEAERLRAALTRIKDGTPWDCDAHKTARRALDDG